MPPAIGINKWLCHLSAFEQIPAGQFANMQAVTSA